MNFVAIDVETANADVSSICQVGMAKYSKGEIVAEWCKLVNPNEYFDPINIGIHGITESDVIDAPTFAQLSEEILDFVDGQIRLCHSHFDRVSFRQAFANNKIEDRDAQWIDTAMVARRAWTDIGEKGYGLASVCDLIGYKFNHHDALQDAKASAEILLHACREKSVDLNEWITLVSQPIGSSLASTRISREGTLEGPMNGEVVVFTGALSIPRRDAADIAASLGCTVSAGVTKKTTMLVVGDQDVSKLAGKDKSSKHRKVESLVAAGRDIRILRESDFVELHKELLREI